MVDPHPSRNEDLLIDAPSNEPHPPKKKRIRPPSSEARKAQIRAHMVAWRLKHPEEDHARNVAWRAAHPEKV
jgi:hypothetical protein